MTAFTLPSNTYGLDEVRVVSDSSGPVCHIYLDQNEVIVNDCTSLNP